LFSANFTGGSALVAPPRSREGLISLRLLDRTHRLFIPPAERGENDFERLSRNFKKFFRSSLLVTVFLGFASF